MPGRRKQSNSEGLLQPGMSCNKKQPISCPNRADHTTVVLAATSWCVPQRHTLGASAALVLGEVLGQVRLCPLAAPETHSTCRVAERSTVLWDAATHPSISSSGAGPQREQTWRITYMPPAVLSVLVGVVGLRWDKGLEAAGHSLTGRWLQEGPGSLRVCR